MRKVTSSTLVVLLAAAAASGCSKVKHFMETPPDPDKMARVYVDYEGEKVEVTVAASGNENSVLGVGELRNEDWDKAADAFQKAVAADPKDYRSQFGAAVAYEMAKNYSAAEEHYKAANLLHADPAYTAGLHRVRTGATTRSAP